MYITLITLFAIGCTETETITEIVEVEKIVTETVTVTEVETVTVTNNVYVLPEEYSFTRGGVSTVYYTGQTARVGMATELKSAMNNTAKTKDQIDTMFASGTGFNAFSALDATLILSSVTLTTNKSPGSEVVVPIPTICDVVWIPVIDVVNAPAPPPPPPAILMSTVVPETANVLPAPIKLSCVIPAPIWVPADWIPICEAPLNNVAVATPAFPNLILFPTSKKSPTITPVLAVMTPIESTFFTSSYVNVPPIVTLPVNVAAPETLILSKGPSNFVAVMIPDECILWLSMWDREWIPGPTTLVNASYIF